MMKSSDDNPRQYSFFWMKVIAAYFICYPDFRYDLPSVVKGALGAHLGAKARRGLAP